MSEAVVEEQVEDQENGLPKLPEGWEWRTVAEVAPIRRKPRGLSLPEQVPFVAMADISETAAPIKQFNERDREKVTSSYFEDGDLLVSRITPCFENGKQGVVRGVPGGFGFATTEVYSLACGEEATADYLNLLLSSPLVRGKLIPRMEGATGRMRLPKSALEELMIPVPPIEIQRRLVTKIAERFGEISELNAQLDVVENLQDQFRQALLRDSFTGRLTSGDDLPDPDEVDEDGRPVLPDGWAWKTVGDLGSYINGRGFKKSEWSTSGRPIIRIQNLTDPNKPFNHFEGDAEQDHVVHDGDILVSWAATLNVFLWSGQEAVLNQHIFKVVSDVDPSFHFWALKSVISQLYSRSQGSGMVHIRRKEFEAIPIAVPGSREHQRQVARSLEEAHSRMEGINQDAGLIRGGLESLRASVLHQAFTGQLIA